MLRDFAHRQQQQTGALEVESEDFMDDGTPIRLRVQINEKEVSSKTLPLSVQTFCLTQLYRNATAFYSKLELKNE